jgi:solute:Na+ symporter, SSS family
LLAGLVLAYLAASAAIGFYAATRVRGARDFALASGRFGTAVVAATVFATWFGAETVLGIPATFLKEGLRGLVADPFAAMACLLLVAFAFARPFHRLAGLTLGDYFRARFDRPTEIALTLCIAYSYLGWVAGQFVALGLAFNVLSGGAIGTTTGIVAGALVVIAYTMAGGMWSVALTDFFQALVIIAGLAVVAWIVVGDAGGPGVVFEAAARGGRLRFLPEAEPGAALAWITSALVIVLGSVPQQDVLQRVKSARGEDVAVRASALGGVLYFVIAFVPIALACAALVIDAPMVERLAARDPQLILPTLILERTPLAVQALFFGALLSAILSTAGGALLAPAVTLAENVVRPLLRADEGPRLLWILRVTVLSLGLAVLAMALDSSRSIYQLVNDSGKVVLVSAFGPLAGGLFWKRASARGAHAAIVLGLGTWLTLEWLAPQAMVPPALAGFAASALGLVVGSLAAPARGAPPA